MLHVLLIYRHPVMDSEHVSGVLTLFSHLHLIQHVIVPADRSSRPLLGRGVLHSTPYLPLFSSLYAPNFPINLLVSQLTNALNCSITFSPDSCVF